MTGYIIFALIFCLSPAGVLWLCRKVRIFGKIGPVLLLYLLGILIGNLGMIPGWNSSAVVPASLPDILCNITIPLAIPLMLFSCTFDISDAKDQIKAIFTGIAAVAMAVIAGYLIFGKHLEEGAKIGGMLTAVYTGGTINMASLKTMLDVKNETFIMLNAYDMVICFLYLTFLLLFGIKLSRKILPARTSSGVDPQGFAVTGTDSHPYRMLLSSQGRKDVLILLAVTLVICGISAAAGSLAPEGGFMVVFILMLTTCGIIASFSKKLRNKQYGFDIGMYLIYIFSISVASMANFSEIDLSGSIYALGYLSFIIFGSLILQLILSIIFKIDADTTVISSVAYINSPPFVPMIAAAMHNKRVLVSGLSIGIIGYAVGNYLGFVIYRLLEII